MLAAMDEPDPFEKTRLILARQRHLGEPFSVAWPRAVDVAAPRPDRQRHMTQEMRDRDAERAALLANEVAWRAGYERRPLPARPKPSLPVPAGPFPTD
jgi:hypothetical protein